MKYTFLTVLLLSALVAKAQGKDYSQEAAEREALQKYEATYKAPDSLPLPDPAPNEAFFGAHLVRTATLLATSSAQRRYPVKVLIYGQSITGSKVFTDTLYTYLKEKFPFADLQVENRSIGGFSAGHIIRTAPHDLYYTNADLVIFHVYGGEKTGELEQLFTNLRRTSTADILLFNHHQNGDRKKPDAEGASYLRYIANKYDCELADVSTEWPAYMEKYKLQAKDLLRDNVHPNRYGNWLLIQLLGRHIRYNPLFTSNWYQTVQTAYAVTGFEKGKRNAVEFSGEPWQRTNYIATGNNRNGTLLLHFYGNRVDITSGEALQPGSARLLLDGKPVSAYPQRFMITRPSAGPGTWWPGIRQVSHVKPLQEEDWTLEIEKINADSTVYTYRVKGSKTGYDGTGNSKETFISTSGRVVIEPADVFFADIKKTFKVPVPTGFIVKWSVVPLFSETFQAPATTDKTKIYKTTLVQGLDNGVHSLQLIPNGDGPVPVISFDIHRPPLEN
jgi:hypothetical protein